MKETRPWNAATPRDYVQQLNLRHPLSPHVYRTILNEFYRFVTPKVKNGRLSEKLVREWLEARLRVWPFHLVAHRARLVDRYLDWAVQAGGPSENPLATLRKKYGQRTTTPVVRALLSSDPAAALEALRPAARFTSFLGTIMREHLALMRAMGYRYDGHEKHMLKLDRFLQDRSELAGQSLRMIIHEWTKAKLSPEHALQCLKVGRVLSKALSRIDPSNKGIAWDRWIVQEAKRHHRRPYILSESNICQILQAALSLPSPRSPLRPKTAYTMLVLAYCAGLRLGEIVRLNLGDVDLETCIIEIRETKFFKTRRLPLSKSAAAALSAYLYARRKAGAPVDPEAGLFWHWHNRGAGRYSYVMTEHMLVRVLRHAGIKPTKGKAGPRIHDLRHAFVVHRMLAWYRQGVNPQPYLPYLATYMGHRDINSTLVYLTITQELLQHAGEKYRQSGAFALGKTTGGEQ
jgi:integrase/recombinase XerD